MPIVRFARTCPAVLAAFFAMTHPVRAQVQAGSAVAGDRDSTHGELSEIVVTAQRRAQNMQDVPISVSAIGGDQLVERGIRTGQDLLGNIGGLSAASAGEGRQNIAIRGISTQAGLPVVGIYLDDVPLLQTGAHGQTSAIDPDFFDLNRIEVLRGPQGTLYGASSLGGTPRYITNQPSAAAFAAKVATEAYVTAHGALSDSFDAMVNIPLGNRWAVRIVDSYSSTDTKDRSVTQIDPKTNQVVRTIAVNIPDETEGSIGVGEGSLWLLTNENGTDSGTLSRLDAVSGKVTANIKVKPKSHAATVAFGSVWVTSSGDGTVERVDPRTNVVSAEIRVHASPRFLAAGADSLWVLSQGDGTLARIDPRTNRVVATVAVGVPGEGGDPSIGEGYVRVSAEGVPLSQIDPRTNKLIRQ